MRWFLTDAAPELEAALRAAGEEVVSGPEDAAASRVTGPDFHPKDYPLDDLALRARADVAVLVVPIRAVRFGEVFAEFGYARGHGRNLRNRGVTLVLFAHDQPRTLERFRAGMNRRCSCEVNDFAVVVVPDAASGDLVRGTRRTAAWKAGDGVGNLVAAVAHAKSGKTYSPRREGRAWG